MNLSLAAITFDTDWAPDFAIEHVARELISRRIKSTWFITHQSPAIQRLFAHTDLFEFGIHPNFLPGSTHGADHAAVLRHLRTLVPDAKAVRTHGLVQSTPLLHLMAADFGIEIDVSLFLPGASHLRPHALHLYDQALTRIPYFWEDDVEAYTPRRSWNLSDSRYHVAGLKIFNFHPMYTYLNCDNMDGYARLKRVKHLPELDAHACRPYVNSGAGTHSFFRQLVDLIEKGQERSFTISEIAALWAGETGGSGKS